MPSNAYIKFEKDFLEDVERIIISHKQLNNNKKGGKRALGHITRSGIIMLSAAWELYIEELIIESVRIICNRIDDPKLLPKRVQKEISYSVKSSKHELKPLELAGDGWRSVYINHVFDKIQHHNTPNSENIDDLFWRFLGIKEISNNWTYKKEINKFIKLRGCIAHRGREAGYITINGLKTIRKLLFIQR